jgi:hypothetical protein
MPHPEASILLARETARVLLDMLETILIDYRAINSRSSGVPRSSPITTAAPSGAGSESATTGLTQEMMDDLADHMDAWANENIEDAQTRRQLSRRLRQGYYLLGFADCVGGGGASPPPHSAPPPAPADGESSDPTSRPEPSVPIPIRTLTDWSAVLRMAVAHLFGFVARYGALMYTQEETEMRSTAADLQRLEAQLRSSMS